MFPGLAHVKQANGLAGGEVVGKLSDVDLSDHVLVPYHPTWRMRRSVQVV